MARTLVVICFISLGWPTAMLADSLSPALAGHYLLTAGGVFPGDEGSVPAEDYVPAGVAIPGEGSGLLSPVSTEENTRECLRTSAGSERPNACLSSVVSGDGFRAGAQLEPAAGDLKLFLLSVVLLGALQRFLTSAYYSALWDRLFSPLNWC